MITPCGRSSPTRAQEAQDAAVYVPRADGCPEPPGSARSGNHPLLAERREGAAALSARCKASRAFCPALLRLERSRHGGDAPRGGERSPLHRDPARDGSGRDHDPRLPPADGAERAGSAAPRGGPGTPGSARSPPGERHHRRRQHQSRLPHRPGTRRSSGIPICTRRRRPTGGATA